MDDPTDGPYPRAPEFEDIVGLCKSLNEQKVHYVLIGGYAVIFHGFARTTKDIDLLIDPSEENVSRIKKAMAILPDNAISLIEDDEVKKYSVVRIADEFVVDLLASACGINYEEAQQEIHWMEIDGVKIPVASKELLIRTKDTIRPSDKMDVEFLMCRIEEEKKSSPP